MANALLILKSEMGKVKQSMVPEKEETLAPQCLQTQHLAYADSNDTIPSLPFDVDEKRDEPGYME